MLMPKDRNKVRDAAEDVRDAAEWVREYADAIASDVAHPDLAEGDLAYMSHFEAKLCEALNAYWKALASADLSTRSDEGAPC